jgi:hypothetical protein
MSPQTPCGGHQIDLSSTYLANHSSLCHSNTRQNSSLCQLVMISYDSSTNRVSLLPELHSSSDIVRPGKSKCLPPCRCRSVKERLLRKCSDSRSVPRLVPLIIPASVVDGDPVVPKCGCTRAPLESHLDIDVLLVHIIQVVEDDIALSSIQANDTISHGSVNPQRLPSRSWVYTNERMNTFNVFWSLLWMLSVQIRMCAAVHGFLAVDYRPEARRELFICGIPLNVTVSHLSPTSRNVTEASSVKTTYLKPTEYHPQFLGLCRCVGGLHCFMSVSCPGFLENRKSRNELCSLHWTPILKVKKNLTYPAGCLSCTRSVCHLEAPPVCLKLALNSVAWSAGQITVVPITPGTDGTCGYSTVKICSVQTHGEHLHELRFLRTTLQAFSVLGERCLDPGKIQHFSLQSKDQAHPSADR